MRHVLLLTFILTCFMILSSTTWVSPASSVVSAQDQSVTLQSRFTAQPPTIDGQIQDGEWNGATIEPFTFFMIDLATGGDTRFIPADFYLMNDQKNLYLGLRILGLGYNNPGIAGNGFDAVFVLFDNNDDGTVSGGEDQKLVLTIQPTIANGQRGAYADNHAQVADDDDGSDLHLNGLARIVHSNVGGTGNYTVEFAIPLDSGDPFDLSKTADGQVRFNLLLATGIGGTLEAGGFFGVEFEDSTGWGLIQLQPGQPPPEAEPLPGVLAFITNEFGEGRQIYVMDAGGSNLDQRTAGEAVFSSPSLSSDKQNIVYTARNPENPESQEIFLVSTSGRARPKRLTNNNVADTHPVFSPDGRDIVFTRGGNIWLMRSNGLRERQLTDLGLDSEPVWSPDGRIVFTTLRWSELPEVAIMDADGENLLRLTDNPQGSLSPRVSPDGQWVTFFRYDGPGPFSDFNVSLYYPWNIYRVRTDGSDEQRLTDDGSLNLFPTFAPDGRGILYVKILDVSTFYSNLFYLEPETGRQRRVLENSLTRIGDPIDWR